MTNEYYQLPLTERRRMLADAGYVRNDLRVWQHADGNALGEGVAAALTDDAFLRFLQIESLGARASLPATEPQGSVTHL